jgi:spermidine/putrescine transport system substrate-binding protein
MKTSKPTVSRRDALKTLAAAGVTYSVLPMISNPAAASDRVHYHTWAGYDIPELMADYVAKYGEMPATSNIGNEEDSLAKMMTGWAPDLMHPGNYNVKRWHEAGLLQPFDVSKVGNWPDLFPGIQNEESAKVDGKQFMIPSEFGNSSVVYRTDLVDPEYIENNS